MKVHHVGIVVKDIEKACLLYRGLGYVQVDSIIEDNVQHNRLLFLKNGELLVELIEPINSSSPVYNPRNLGYHHICYEVEDLDKAIFFL
ncbi:VOC family protein [Acetomicrobium sp.]|uniref:VOC family protein n=1 Tax=Acetomicrobium sp. TaxID=1872099 RepID=UPI002871902B|nr:VOC family protein [Acetomicrobium sp.]MDR9770435.1 VOC family protein [Acetomicrobium sp.]